jgi:oxygen-independent coproporphyrinogen-3 oxidase
MPGLYIHIPFCKQACHYCDFHFSTNLTSQDEMVNALCLEIGLQKDYLKARNLDSIYFGGGTPSLLTPKHLEQIFNCIAMAFNLVPSCEITLEANPDDLSLEHLKLFRQAGINRLSIGVQSFDDKILKFLNRSHDGQMAQQALENCRIVGFKNVSIDLIYAIPDQDHELLSDNIDKALAFAPEHFSGYSLTIEPKTVFGNWAKKEKLVPVEEAANAEQFELLSTRLSKEGYEHYEISNFCKPGLYSRHNSSYWSQEEYLGIGPSAHSYNIQSRQSNINNNAQYIKSINHGKVPFEFELLSEEDKINEYVFTTLRTSYGCNLKKLKRDHAFNLIDLKSEYIDKLIANDLALLDNDVLQLTFKGKLVADQIALDLMV